jgi:hypothetical protein
MPQYALGRLVGILHAPIALRVAGRAIDMLDSRMLGDEAIHLLVVELPAVVGVDNADVLELFSEHSLQSGHNGLGYTGILRIADLDTLPCLSGSSTSLTNLEKASLTVRIHLNSSEGSLFMSIRSVWANPCTHFVIGIAYLDPLPQPVCPDGPELGLELLRPDLGAARAVADEVGTQALWDAEVRFTDLAKHHQRPYNNQTYALRENFVSSPPLFLVLLLQDAM